MCEVKEVILRQAPTDRRKLLEVLDVQAFYWDVRSVQLRLHIPAESGIAPNDVLTMWPSEYPWYDLCDSHI